MRWIILLVFLGLTGAGIYALYRYREELAIVGEFFEFLKARKLWWLSPIIIFLLIAGILIFVFETGALSSFMYVLF